MYRQIHVGCLLLKYQVRYARHQRRYLYRIHDLLTRCVHQIVHLQVLLTRCGHIIIDLGVRRTSSEVKDNTAIMLKIFPLCIYLPQLSILIAQPGIEPQTFALPVI